MTQRQIRAAIVCVFLLVSVRLFWVSSVYNLWREFFVSEIQLVAVAGVLWYLLRRPDPPKKGASKPRVS